MMRFRKICILSALLVAAVSCEVKNEPSSDAGSAFTGTEDVEQILDRTVTSCRSGRIDEISGVNKGVIKKEAEEFLKQNGNIGASAFFIQKYPELFFISEMGRTGVSCEGFEGKPLRDYIGQRANQIWLKTYLEMNLRQLRSLEKGVQKGLDLSHDIAVIGNLISVNRQFITEKTDLDFLKKKIIYSDEVEKPAERLVLDIRNCLYRFGGIRLCEDGRMPGIMNWKTFKSDYVKSVDVIVSKDDNYIVKFNVAEEFFGENAELVIRMNYDGKNVNYRLDGKSGCVLRNLCNSQHFQ